MSSKPWMNLEMDYKNIWWYSSHIDNNYHTIPDGETPIAYFIIQDHNMAGNYFRYFKWFKNSNNRYLEVSPKWIFDKSMCNMKNGTTTIDSQNNKYIVFDKFHNDFIKILEIVN